MQVEQCLQTRHIFVEPEHRADTTTVCLVLTAEKGIGVLDRLECQGENTIPAGAVDLKEVLMVFV